MFVVSFWIKQSPLGGGLCRLHWLLNVMHTSAHLSLTKCATKRVRCELIGLRVYDLG